MTCAPGSVPLERLWRGLKEETHRQVASGGGLETFASWLAVSPRAGSGHSRLSRSRGNRHGRLGRNSLGGHGEHIDSNITQEGIGGKGIKEKNWRCAAVVRNFRNLSLCRRPARVEGVESVLHL